MDKGSREPGRIDVYIREPSLGLLWGTGMFGFPVAFQSEAARRVTPPPPDGPDPDEERIHELLGELLGDAGE